MTNGSILVVDDNRENLKLLKAVLEDAGYEVRPGRDLILSGK